MHHDAQKLRTTGVPRKSDRRTVPLPSSEGSAKSGAVSPTDGAPSAVDGPICPGIVLTVGVAAVDDSEPSSATASHVTTPMATTTSNATAARTTREPRRGGGGGAWAGSGGAD